jgi:polar amino acid transport system substrate-binding protein
MIGAARSPLVAISVVAVALIAGACGDEDGNQSTGKLETITEGKLVVGSYIQYPPFEFGRAPNYQGLDVDVVREVAKQLKLEAQFVNTPFDTIFRNLAQRKFDMVASATTITAERKEEVDFSDPYFPADQSLMVKRGSEIKAVDDLKDRVVGAQLGTTGANYANTKTDAKAVRTYNHIDDALNALAAGQVDAVINDCAVSKYAERAHENLVVVASINTDELYGFAFSKGSDALRAAVNEALSVLRKNGKLDEISETWVGKAPCSGLPSAT